MNSGIATSESRAGGVAVVGLDLQERGDLIATEVVLPSVDLWHAVVDSLPTNVAVLDADGRIVAVNAGWSQFAEGNGALPDTVGPGVDYFAVCASAAADESFASDAGAALREIAGGDRDTFVAEYRCDSPTEQRWFVMRATPYRGAGPGRVVVMHTDITQRRLAEERLATQASILGDLDAAVIATDADGNVTEWNTASERLYGWTRAEMLGHSSRGRIFPALVSEESDRRWADLERSGRWQGDVEALRRDGSTLMVHSRVVAIERREGSRDGYVAVSTDISERLAAEVRSRDAADYLRALTDSVGDGLFALDSSGRVTRVNDAAVRMLGWPREQLVGNVMHELCHYRHADGTQYAAADCPIVRACGDDTIARIDDDVFIRHDGSELPVAYTASPFHTDAGVAGAVVVFRDISEEKARQKRLRAMGRDFRWAERVREALDNTVSTAALQLYAQPIVEIASDAMVCEELLLRMHRDTEVVPPAKFLPPAMRHGLMPQIDRWVLEEAVRLASAGRPVALNLSSLAFNDFDLLADIELQLDVAGLDPALLTFEVTETSVIEDHDAACRFLTRLREVGCKLALDDFGTGFSGFMYLKRLPVDYIKIDREFVRDLAKSDSSQHVVEAVVNISQMFGHLTIAEGVEDQETLTLLADMGVNHAQGYFLGRPAPAEDRITTGETGTIR
jgi:PAS domain S-box-containing protein